MKQGAFQFSWKQQWKSNHSLLLRPPPYQSLPEIQTSGPPCWGQCRACMQGVPKPSSISVPSAYSEKEKAIDPLLSFRVTLGPPLPRATKHLLPVGHRKEHCEVTAGLRQGRPGPASSKYPLPHVCSCPWSNWALSMLHKCHITAPHPSPQFSLNLSKS
jgi:hypothetical protein